MRLYSHVITNDTGLAPNPFHGYCTSALCTPSHMNAKLEKGDWLIGHSQKKNGNRLVYAMRISEVLSMNQYFYDRRFDLKKPIPNGSIIEQCGDNIYYKGTDANWQRLPSHFHNDRKSFIKDLGKRFLGHPVFVANHFYYFGCRQVAIPDKLVGVICGSQGIRKKKGSLADGFVTWLEANHKPGISGKPCDMADRSDQTDMMLTNWTDYNTEQPKKQELPDCSPKSRSFTKSLRSSRGCR